jgi:hypothetical protein
MHAQNRSIMTTIEEKSISIEQWKSHFDDFSQLLRNEFGFHNIQKISILDPISKQGLSALDPILRGL